MKGIDTNVLVRYITEDGDEAVVATAFMETELTESNPGYVCLVVLCELVWVLRRAYKYDRSAVCRILATLLASREIEIESSGVAWRALEQFSSGSADFSDYVIGQLNQEHGAKTTVTFDRNAASSPQFTLLSR